MPFTPRNRHILIELSDTPSEEIVEGSFTGVLLPEDYKPTKEQFVTARVCDISPDCSVGVSKGDRVVVNNTMVQELTLETGKVNIILENYVLGVLTRDR
jgi:co-chaperonin GroES (HSP10)|tara:strand:- start:146 stop:442 length:297 start_codon:yes stop_codon:yes gene_type:complete